MWLKNKYFKSMRCGYSSIIQAIEECVFGVCPPQKADSFLYAMWHFPDIFNSPDSFWLQIRRMRIPRVWVKAGLWFSPSAKGFVANGQHGLSSSTLGDVRTAWPRLANSTACHRVLRAAHALLQKGSNSAGGSRTRKCEKEPGGEKPTPTPSGLRLDTSVFWTQHPNNQHMAVTHSRSRCSTDAWIAPGHTVLHLGIGQECPQ